MDTDAYPQSGTLFRPPAKRRKFLRRRADNMPEESDSMSGAGDSLPEAPRSRSQSPRDTPRETASSADLIRRRRLHRARRGGIEFSATSRQTTDVANQSALSSASTEELEAERIKTMCDRFTAHTGQTVDVDRHMMTYIESEMAKRNQRAMPMDAADSDAIGTKEASGAPSSSDLPQREPASLGKLHEIDLGQETKLENIARTEAATRRLADGDREEDAQPRDDESLAKSTPTRRDNRSWRHQKRRTSEDVQRDRLVEEVLRESRLDVYDEPAEEITVAADDQAADDRVAEQFRRDFLDAIQSRRRVARARNTKTTKPEAPRGPKLGGSRSARAAMREMQDKSGRK
ncbi:hypothetical protein P170DRAFT_474037 [Aspergillus steynii IBT 23096]|uniref:Hepatocellular carcinoma-associated antigen 59-domain-containing protein n=1 Tax=Aspergillus steynii IBT 23096 TaxID=1392250 RepID=A0A2I2GC77_9EURO|nr:uncharacterized protein P170DRAFT_474037 [Aspergillus steynii IBT 23096]PLB50488.1 hypothetical protein P170DRAFT_474037 [Aspergillus steynii IBT 23096]